MRSEDEIKKQIDELTNKATVSKRSNLNAILGASCALRWVLAEEDTIEFKSAAELRIEHLQAEDKHYEVLTKLREEAGWPDTPGVDDPAYSNPPELVKAWVDMKVAEWKLLQAEGAAIRYYNPKLDEAIRYLKAGEKAGLTIGEMDKWIKSPGK